MTGGPVFVLTVHRSGGTALARGLNRHPDLMIWGEHAGFINRLAEQDEVIGHYPPLTRKLDPAQLADYVRLGKFAPEGFDPWANPFEQRDWRDWCRNLIETTFRRGLHPGQRWGFKEVRYHTLTTARFLATLFPDARFVILLRELTPLVLSNMLSPWSMGILRNLGATASEAGVRAAVHDCAYALAVINRGLASIARALADPVPTFGALFGFLGLPQWPALLDEVKETSGRQLGATNFGMSVGFLSRETVVRLMPGAIAAAEADLATGEPDLARLKRLGPTGRYSFLVGDHDLAGTPYSTMF
jgi:hypothetical protein